MNDTVTDQEIIDHLRAIGIDRWTGLRKIIEGALKGAAAHKKPQAVFALASVLQWMDYEERFERDAIAAYRIGIGGDIVGMLEAAARIRE